jgi:large subunit ribosomal protein L3
MIGLLGKKKGMTQIFDKDGNQVPVTVIETGPCTVTQKKTLKNEKYDAIQIAFEEISKKKSRKASKPYSGHFKKSKLKTFRYLKEIRTDDPQYEIGQVITIASFKSGDALDITGTSKGKGFQGVIKRHGKAGGPASHGSRFHRTPGSIGQCAWPGRVFKNMKLPGQMGNKRITTLGLKLVEVRPEENLLLVRGSIPGADGGVVFISNRNAKLPEPVKEKVENTEAPKA